MKVLLTGGVRSGKSTHAEALLKGHDSVLYVAPGPTPDAEQDADWAARIAAHRARRPSSWTTLETRDLAAALRSAEGPVLIDCLGTWLSGVLDDANAWDAPDETARGVVAAPLDALVAAIDQASVPVVIVTNEVGMGIVPEHRSGRLFRDLLGVVNQHVASACDDVLLVVAGRVLRL